MNKSYLQPIIYSLLIIFGIIIGNSSKNKSTNKYKKIDNVIDLINDHYVDSLDKDFNDKIITSLLNQLDPHSTYINSKKIKSVEEDMQGSFSGIGVQFNIIEDSIVVISPISGGPSEKLGILSGDRIVKIEEEDVAGINISNEDVISRLRGEKGAVVNIKIYRRSISQLIDFSIIRDDIPLYSVDASFMITNEIGYIKINRFSATTYEEFNQKVLSLLNKGMEKLILDLRGNPGGFLSESIKICDDILKENNLIVYTQGRNRKKQNVYATERGSLHEIKINIIIDEGSASASEIVAGAIQDNDRGTIIGRRSFGKGLVQEQINLSDGDAIRLTTQRYYTPSGRCIQRSYGKNKKDYYTNLLSKQNESQNTFEDSLKYKTKNGRLVYGGGGIFPDIIIKQDTSLNFLQINLIISKGWIGEFALNQSSILNETYLDKKDFIKNLNKDIIYNSFLDFLEKKDANITLDIGAVEKLYLKTLLKATIARNIWDNNTYFEILNQQDEFIKEAINSFN